MTTRDQLIALGLLVPREAVQPHHFDAPTLRLDGLARRTIERRRHEPKPERDDDG